MKKLLLLTTSLIFAAGAAMAAITADQLVTTYQNQGYTSIEVTTGVTQIKVEAISGQTKLEVIYDIATGAIIKQEQQTIGATDSAQGVEIGSSDSDFVGAGDGKDHHGFDGDKTDDDSAEDASDDDTSGSGKHKGRGGKSGSDHDGRRGGDDDAGEDHSHDGHGSGKDHDSGDDSDESEGDED